MQPSVLERTNRTFRQATLAFTVGMTLPGVVIAATGTLIPTRLDYPSFLGMLAVGFAPSVVVLCRRLEWDRPTLLVVAIVWPWIVFFIGLFTVLLLNEGEQVPRGPVADVFRTLVGSRYVWEHDAPTVFGYSAVFMLTGIAVIVLSNLWHRLRG